MVGFGSQLSQLLLKLGLGYLGLCPSVHFCVSNLLCLMPLLLPGVAVAEMQATPSFQISMTSWPQTSDLISLGLGPLLGIRRDCTADRRED